MTDLMEIVKMVQDYERDLAEMHTQIEIMSKQMAKAKELANNVLQEADIYSYSKKLYYASAEDEVTELIAFIAKYDYEERVKELLYEKGDTDETK